MTPTLNELVYSIWSVVRPSQGISDPITDDLIKFQIKSARAALIRQDLNKGRSVDNYIVQDLGCIALVTADASECCAAPTGCNVLRTSVPIPSMIELYNKPLITRVGSVNKKDKKWDLIPYERVPFEGLNKYTKELIKVYQINNSGYLYVLVPEGASDAIFLDYINVQGVLEDPSDAKTFNYPCVQELSSAPCFSDDAAYPIKYWMVDPIKQMVLKFLGLEAKAPIDNTSNNKPDFEQPIVNT